MPAAASVARADFIVVSGTPISLARQYAARSQSSKPDEYTRHTSRRLGIGITATALRSASWCNWHCARTKATSSSSALLSSSLPGSSSRTSLSSTVTEQSRLAFLAAWRRRK